MDLSNEEIHYGAYTVKSSIKTVEYGNFGITVSVSITNIRRDERS